MRSLRSISILLLLCGSAACRLDFNGQSSSADRESADERPQSRQTGRSAAGSGGSARSANASDTSDTGGKTDANSEDSALACATAAVLRIARPLNSGDNVRLSGSYMVTGNVHLDGDVDVAPGTTFIVAVDSSVEFGWNGTRTSLQALGTPDAPIRFCSDSPVLGRWGGVRLSAVTSDSSFEHVHIYDAGSNGAALRVVGPARLSDVTIHGSKKVGVSADSFGEGSQRLVVRGAQAAAVELTGAVAIHNFPANSVFSDNADNVAHITFSGTNTLGPTIHVPKLPIPYVQDKSIEVYHTSWEFEAGVEYRFAADTFLGIGWNGEPATIQIAGTATEPVVFRGTTAKKGHWKGLLIRNKITPDSLVSHIQISDAGGGGTPAFSVNSQISVQDVEVRNSAAGATITSVLQSDSANLTVTGCDGPALTSQLAAVRTLPRGGQLKGNAQDTIVLGTVFGTDPLGALTVPNLGVPYYITGNLAIGQNSELTFEPGVEFVFQSGQKYGLVIGWNGNVAKVNALGTALAPIIFRGEKDEPGSWAGIVVSSAVSTNSVFDHIRVQGAALSTAAPIAITNSTFTKSPTYGILRNASNMTDYMSTNTFVDNVQGNVGSL